VHPVGRQLERVSPVRPWAVLAGLGSLATALAVWHYFQEVRGIGIGVGPIAAVAMGVSLSAGVFYAGVRLRASDATPAEGWVVVATGVGGGVFAAVGYGLTLAVRVAEGRPLVEPLFPTLVIGSIGTLAGTVIGSEYAETRRLAQEARETRDAMVFTNSLLRHDVRNAIQIIDGHASLLCERGGEQVRDSAETIGGQTESLERIVTEIESVVDVLNGEAGGQTADLSTVLDDVVEAVAADQTGVTVETDLSGEFPVAGGEALYPVFSNVLGNAIEHGGGESVRISVTARRDSGRAVVVVADDGPGIPPDERERVFERDVGTDGDGYGLYVARTVVDHLDGEIRVEESDLGGAAFVVTVPLRDDTTGGRDRQ
jgi:signal transduction histidine kinase